jgi:hypothetical protein
MSGLMHDVARAALPVAIGLLLLAAAARALLAAPVEDAPARRLARLCLEPLSTWCLAALAVYAVALGAAGEMSGGSLVLALALGAAAAALWFMSDAGDTAPAEPARRPAAAHAPRRPPRPQPDPAPVPPPPGGSMPSGEPTPPGPAVPPAPAPAGRLWADPAEDEAARRNGLWSRA